MPPNFSNGWSNHWPPSFSQLPTFPQQPQSNSLTANDNAPRSTATNDGPSAPIPAQFPYPIQSSGYANFDNDDPSLIDQLYPGANNQGQLSLSRSSIYDTSSARVDPQSSAGSQGLKNHSGHVGDHPEEGNQTAVEQDTEASRDVVQAATDDVNENDDGEENDEEEEYSDGEEDNAGPSLPGWDSSISDASQARAWLSANPAEPLQVRPLNDDVATELPKIAIHAKKLFDALSRPQPSPPASWTANQKSYYIKWQAKGMESVLKMLKSTSGSKRAQSNCLLAIEAANSLHHGLGLPTTENQWDLESNLKLSERVSQMINCVQLKYVADKIIKGHTQTISNLAQNPKKMLIARENACKNNAAKQAKQKAGEKALAPESQSSTPKKSASKGSSLKRLQQEEQSNFGSSTGSQDTTLSFVDSSMSSPQSAAPVSRHGVPKRRRLETSDGHLSYPATPAEQTNGHQANIFRNTMMNREFPTTSSSYAPPSASGLIVQSQQTFPQFSDQGFPPDVSGASYQQAQNGHGGNFSSGSMTAEVAEPDWDSLTALELRAQGGSSNLQNMATMQPYDQQYNHLLPQYPEYPQQAQHSQQLDQLYAEQINAPYYTQSTTANVNAQHALAVNGNLSRDTPYQAPAEEHFYEEGEQAQPRRWTVVDEDGVEIGGGLLEDED